jgi:ubiquitin-protein ligase
MAPEPSNPRENRLDLERQRLEQVNRESEYVITEPIGNRPGRAPERYKITLLCRGIVGIDSLQNPVYGDQHEFQIYCDNEFPSHVPRLRWTTPIWHPNIQHDGDKNVCVNKAEWLGAMGLHHLCQQIFEMVQYKNYHAEETPPYPLDREAAKWVREYAEPRGVVDRSRGISVDSRPFYKASVSGAVRAGRGGADSQIDLSHVSRIRIQGIVSPGDKRTVVRVGSAPVRCGQCGTEALDDSRFCDKCGARLPSGLRSNIRINS